MTATGQYDNVACPFCGILCDDLTVERCSAGLKVKKNGCGKAVAGFERAAVRHDPPERDVLADQLPIHSPCGGCRIHHAVVHADNAAAAKACSR